MLCLLCSLQSPIARSLALKQAPALLQNLENCHNAMAAVPAVYTCALIGHAPPNSTCVLPLADHHHASAVRSKHGSAGRDSLDRFPAAAAAACSSQQHASGLGTPHDGHQCLGATHGANATSHLATLAPAKAVCSCAQGTVPRHLEHVGPQASFRCPVQPPACRRHRCPHHAADGTVWGWGAAGSAAGGAACTHVSVHVRVPHAEESLPLPVMSWHFPAASSGWVFRSCFHLRPCHTVLACDPPSPPALLSVAGAMKHPNSRWQTRSLCG